VIGDRGDVGTIYSIDWNATSNGWTTFSSDQTGQMYQRIKFNNPDIAHAYVGITGGNVTCRVRTLALKLAQNAPHMSVTQSFTDGMRDAMNPIAVTSAPGASPTRQAGTFYLREDTNKVGTRVQLGWKRNDADNGFEELWAEDGS